MTFNPAPLLASLPYRLQPPPPQPGARFPEWKWPLLPPYNGFSGNERVGVWQVATWLKQHNILALACELCGSDHRLGQLRTTQDWSEW